MSGINYLWSMFPASTNHPQSMTIVSSDIYQFAIFKAYFYPATSRADATEALRPLQSTNLLLFPRHLGFAKISIFANLSLEVVRANRQLDLHATYYLPIC